MADITVPTAGTPILDTWGADVAERLNQLVPLVLEADTATDAAEGAGGATLFEIDCVSGQQYNVSIRGRYEVSATNQGLRLAVDDTATGGTCSGFAQMASTAAATITNANLSAASTWGGTTSTGTATVGRMFRLEFTFDCSSDGTLEVVFARGGTSGSTGVTIHAGSGGLVVVSPA